MNFLELINKCLLELNYHQVNSFSELIKNDHKKIINILNIINKEVCCGEKWNFLLRKSSFTVDKNTDEITNSINGKILYLSINGKKTEFTDKIEDVLFENKQKYSCYSNKLIFPKSKTDRNIEVIYYTNNAVIDENNEEKENLETSSDRTLIPMPFAEQILIYGTCLRMKANPQHYKFPYWMSMYKEALLNLKSKELASSTEPVIQLFRQ